MTAKFSKPSDFAPTARKAGGDDKVPRDKKDRPRIVVACWSGCEGSGKVPSEKTGKPIQCKGCKGKGKREKSYTRTTTFIDVIEDKSNLEAWQMRMVLVGADMDRDLLNGVHDLQLELLDAQVRGDQEREKKAKDEINRRAQIAKKLAGAEDKADKGTFLHGLSEMVDEDVALPPEISFEDVIDMDSYRRVTKPFEIVHMERLVVHDDYCIGGTPDRVSRWIGTEELVAPDGSVISPDDLLITDLKTGTVEYGGLKMCMQLAIYSRSKLYDLDKANDPDLPASAAREDLDQIRTDWGIIMNLPAGSGETTLYWADLNLGWKAVEVAKSVRELRSMSRNALTMLASATAA